MKCELLAPAGNPEKLKLALYYGADAVYLGGKNFSLRSYADNFSDEELEEGISFAHAHGKKVYVAANIFARNADFGALGRYFGMLSAAGADAVLVSDPGVFALVREAAPALPVHISTQANTCNARAARFWAELGAKRIVLARELSLAEIAEIHAAVPEAELEAFVHGAMCISYSGRCYLSDYLAGRSSNRGECSQPCRNAYTLVTAEGETLPCEEDGRGTYLLNSRDLNMIDHLHELEAAGVCSFKIEGRMKSEFYLAAVVNAYRRAMDGDQNAGEELKTISHRDYTTAYALGENRGTTSPSSSQVAGTKEFVAIVKGMENGRVFVEMRNRFREGETLEILTPSRHFGEKVRVEDMKDAENNSCSDAKLVQGSYSFACPYPLRRGDIFRR